MSQFSAIAGSSSCRTKPGIDDRLVFLAHRIGAGEQQFLLGLVVCVGDARGAARGDRAHEALLDPGRLHRRLEVGDVGLDRVLAGIGDRRDADRRRRPRPGGDAGLGIGVGRGELAAVPAIAEARQHDLARAGPSRRHVVQARALESQPAEALPRIAPPRAVVDALRPSACRTRRRRGCRCRDRADGARPRPPPRAMSAETPPRRSARRLHARGSPRSAHPGAAGCRHGWSRYGRRWLS